MFSVMTDRLDKRLDKITKKFDNEISTVWRRFDERKRYLDCKCDATHKEFSEVFLRKDAYETNHSHLQQVLESQFNLHIKVIDEKINSIKTVIDELKEKIK